MLMGFQEPAPTIAMLPLRTNSSFPATSVSVILCTHNPRPDYLSRVLASLRGQILPAKQWELLLIDNASDRPLAKTVDISWHSRGRHIREDELGLTVARLRGIQESSSELLVFVDDDNLLAPDFLVQATAISARRPDLGAFGAGILKPEFEVQPPVKLRPRLGMLALRRERSALWSYNTTDTRCRPWGSRTMRNSLRCELLSAINTGSGYYRCARSERQSIVLWRRRPFFTSCR
jgi:glycosyltransferase involved in cell wall biosynthesis